MSTRESKLHALNIAHVRTTRNSIRTSARQSSIETLDSIVVCLTDLGLAARQAHWNVRGREFTSLHDLFGRVSDEANKHTDVLAERAAALGGIPRCTAQAVVAGTKLKPYPSFGFYGAEHVDELATRMAAVGTELRAAIIDIEGRGDPVTSHLLTDAAATLDHLLWLLESHLPTDGPDTAGKTPV